jgi:hypothetical protein
MRGRSGQERAILVVLCAIRRLEWVRRHPSRIKSGLRLELVIGQCVQSGLLLFLSVGDDQHSSGASQANIFEAWRLKPRNASVLSARARPLSRHCLSMPTCCAMLPATPQRPEQGRCRPLWAIGRYTVAYNRHDAAVELQPERRKRTRSRPTDHLRGARRAAGLMTGPLPRSGASHKAVALGCRSIVRHVGHKEGQ